MTNAKQVQSIKLFKNGKSIGHLNRTDSGCEIAFLKEVSGRITYHTTANNRPEPYSGVNLPAYFANLLPEGLRLKALTKKIKTSTDDMFSLLVEAGADPVGDIHFENPFNQKMSIDKNIILDFEKIKADLKKAVYADSNVLAGVQNKVSADRITLPIRFTNKNKSYILKLASDEFADSIQNEFICLHVAELCGLKVNKSKIIKDKNNQPALLIERFDREWDTKSQSIKRLHQEDACQFLNKYPADKYNISMQQIADGIKSFSASPQIDVLMLLQSKAFSYLIGNGDLHAKNISLLQDQFSPCYDILCTSIYGDQKMALMMDGKNENLKLKGFVDFGIRNSLPKKSVEVMIKKLVNQFRRHQNKIFLIPLAEKKKKLLTQQFKKRIEQLGS